MIALCAFVICGRLFLVASIYHCGFPVGINAGPLAGINGLEILSNPAYKKEATKYLHRYLRAWSLHFYSTKY
jgi:hypothetical protein